MAAASLVGKVVTLIGYTELRNEDHRSTDVAGYADDKVLILEDGIKKNPAAYIPSDQSVYRALVVSGSHAGKVAIVGLVEDEEKSARAVRTGDPMEALGNSMINDGVGKFAKLSLHTTTLKRGTVPSSGSVEPGAHILFLSRRLTDTEIRDECGLFGTRGAHIREVMVLTGERAGLRCTLALASCEVESTTFKMPDGIDMEHYLKGMDIIREKATAAAPSITYWMIDAATEHGRDQWLISADTSQQAWELLEAARKSRKSIECSDSLDEDNSIIAFNNERKPKAATPSSPWKIWKLTADQANVANDDLSRVMGGIKRAPDSEYLGKVTRKKAEAATEEFEPYAVTNLIPDYLLKTKESGATVRQTCYSDSTVFAVLESVYSRRSSETLHRLRVLDPGSAGMRYKVGDEGWVYLTDRERELPKLPINVYADGSVGYEGRIIHKHTSNQPNEQITEKKEELPMARDNSIMDSAIANQLKENAVQGTVIATCNEGVEIVKQQLSKAARESTNMIVSGMLADAIDSKVGTVVIQGALGVGLPFLLPHIPEGKPRRLAVRAANALQQQGFATAIQGAYQLLAKPLINHLIEAAKTLPDDWGTDDGVIVATLSDGAKVNATEAAKKVVARVKP